MCTCVDASQVDVLTPCHQVKVTPLPLANYEVLGTLSNEAFNHQTFSSFFFSFNPFLTVQVSLPLLSVFGKDAPSSQWLCVFLLDKVTFNLSVWSMEESVAMDTVALLGTLVKNTDRQGEENKLDRKVRLRYH